MGQWYATLIFGSKGQWSRSQCIKYWKWFWCIIALPVIMKLHTKGPHELRMCPIAFGVKDHRSKSQYIEYWKQFLALNYFAFTPIIMELHIDYPWVKDVCTLFIWGSNSKVNLVNMIEVKSLRLFWSNLSHLAMMYPSMTVPRGMYETSVSYAQILNWSYSELNTVQLCKHLQNSYKEKRKEIWHRHMTITPLNDKQSIIGEVTLTWHFSFDQHGYDKKL